ncbi:hypothetical protein EYF80_055324 [Liparis tanakae]|uniref:Uncharacterized protein n=1 Tax=Liparis tanakae TaxID=230148 RepID=A0A4Z2EZX7_9TELE|nr:hypothetical protein EYF80_055324 [Liparis tanakae]
MVQQKAFSSFIDDITGVPLQEYDITGVPLQDYDITGVPFQDYDITGVPFQDYDITGVPLQDYDITGVPLQDYDITEDPFQAELTAASAGHYFRVNKTLPLGWPLEPAEQHEGLPALSCSS